MPIIDVAKEWESFFWAKDTTWTHNLLLMMPRTERQAHRMVQRSFSYRMANHLPKWNPSKGGDNLSHLFCSRLLHRERGIFREKESFTFLRANPPLDRVVIASRGGAVGWMMKFAVLWDLHGYDPTVDTEDTTRTRHQMEWVMEELLVLRVTNNILPVYALIAHVCVVEAPSLSSSSPTVVH